MDYRDLPQSELNSNIPKDRNMVQWAPFATMPEQYKNVGKMIESQLHMPEPSLTEDLLQELKLKLRELIDCNVILRHWQVGMSTRSSAR